MNSSSWRNHYEQNKLNRIEPAWDTPCTIPVALRQKLAVSLSHFQLGETGGGTALIREASKKSDADDLAALTSFVKEENEHARLLAHIVQRLGGKLIQKHWTHRIFKFVRRAGGFQFEIQMLLTAEIVGTAYYELIKAHTNDPAINDALGLMLHDEKSHVAFHLDRLRLRWSTYLPLERSSWALQFQLLVLLALRVAWMDHRPCLSALDCTWLDFSQRARQVAIHFLDGLETPTTSCHGCIPAKALAQTIPV